MFLRQMVDKQAVSAMQCNNAVSQSTMQESEIETLLSTGNGRF